MLILASKYVFFSPSAQQLPTVMSQPPLRQTKAKVPGIGVHPDTDKLWPVLNEN